MPTLAHRLATAPRLARPPDPVPIALVITELDVGGAEKALARLATGLDRRRWLPSVLALGPEGAVAESIRAAGVEVDCLGVNRRQPIRAVARLASALREREPALVQSFLFHANLASRLAAPFAGRPWLLGGLRVAERRRNGHLALDRLTAPLALGSVCVSEGVKRFTIERGKESAARLTVIPNGVDPAPFDRAADLTRTALGVPTPSFLTLYIGRLDAQKGLWTLLDAAEIVVGKRKENEWHLVLAGAGPERERLTARVQASPILSSRVHLIGHRSDIPSLLKAADLLVLPSLWEGMPNVVLEAMAARRGVVASRIEGTEELVVPDTTGWLVLPGDPHALAHALQDAASDRDRLRRYGEAGRARVQERFTIARMVEAYDQLWSRVLGFDEGEPASPSKSGAREPS